MSIFKDKHTKFFGKPITIKWYKRIWWKIKAPFETMWWTRFGYYTVLHWYQRAKYIYSYRDVFSIVDWFRDTLPEMLSDLENCYMYKHGIYKFNLENNNLTDNEYLSMKFSLTERIISGIEAHKKWECLEYTDTKEEKIMRYKYEDAMDLFTKYLGIFWD
ncbi:MAG: hypothetical protein K9K32_00190 [Halanaerobiales bacterium]|nr:hypothetical protein [Halanaerobiales bacterium]